MTNLEGIAKLLVMAGLFLLLTGGALFILSKFSVPGIRLPWDIFYRSEKVTVYFPIGTCIAISVILTVLLNLFFRR
jgi:hypothetical protein